MDAGKLGGQTAHACHLALLGDVRPKEGEAPLEELTFTLRGAAARWLQADFTKMTLEVYSEEELRTIYRQAQDAGLPCGLAVDNGWTAFKNQKTATVVAIGPAETEAVNRITGHLKKYQSKSEAA